MAFVRNGTRATVFAVFATVLACGGEGDAGRDAEAPDPGIDAVRNTVRPGLSLYASGALPISPEAAGAWPASGVPADVRPSRSLPRSATPAGAGPDRACEAFAGLEASVASSLPACDPGVLPAGIFEPLSAFDLPRTEIHPATAFDGEAIWLAVNLPAGDGSGNLVPWAARMACDGTMRVAPFLVADVGHNAVDPAIAVSGDSVLVVWQVDDPEKSPDNMDVWVRAFAVDDGAPRSEALLVEPLTAGQPIPGTFWLPSVAPRADGFLVVGALADAQARRFQALVTRRAADGTASLGDDGALDAFLPAREDGVGQVHPTVATAADGTTWLAWERSPDEGQGVGQVVFGTLGPWGEPMVPVPFPDLGVASNGAVLAVADGDPPVVLLAASVGVSDPAIRVRQVSPVADGNDLLLDGPGRVDVSPAVALDPGGLAGLVGWYRLRTGYLADVVVQPFRRVGGVLMARGPETVLNPPMMTNKHDAIAPYPLALTAVGAGRFLVSWVERRTGADAATEYHVRSRFVRP